MRAWIAKHDDPPSCPHGVMAGNCEACNPSTPIAAPSPYRGADGTTATGRYAQTSAAPADDNALIALLAKATPGPYYWFMRECDSKDALMVELAAVVDKTAAVNGYNLHGVAVGEPDPNADYLAVAHTGCGPRSPFNAQMITTVLNTLPALLARLRAAAALRAENARLTRERDQAHRNGIAEAERQYDRAERAEAALAAAQADAKRLEWMQTHLLRSDASMRFADGTFKTVNAWSIASARTDLREAIDAARAKSAQK